MSLSDDGTRSKEILIVSGLPRSGTSLMMKILQVVDFDLLIDNLANFLDRPLDLDQMSRAIDPRLYRNR